MGRYITTTGTAAAVLRTASSAYTAQANDRIICTQGGFTITLPASPVDGDVVQIIDINSAFGASALTVARNGQKIQNLAEDLTLDVNGAVVTLVYSGVTYGWIITSS